MTNIYMRVSSWMRLSSLQATNSTEVSGESWLGSVMDVTNIPLILQWSSVTKRGGGLYVSSVISVIQSPSLGSLYTQTLFRTAGKIPQALTHRHAHTQTHVPVFKQQRQEMWIPRKFSFRRLLPSQGSEAPRQGGKSTSPFVSLSPEFPLDFT